ncbi:cache domain-containing protein [Pseudoalteromonas fenneropenaei]|uniref:Cache domain-containing protein n=1 Tax=Pseudoalteromonas fenneropenaei TaxID=1737459 RepID=A0ABV7CEP0_9GAMM
MTYRSKGLGIIASLLLTLLAVTAVSQAATIPTLDDKTKTLVQTVEFIVGDLSLSEFERQRKVLDLIAQTHLPQGELFVYDTQGKMILYPQHPELNGRILTSHANPVVADSFRNLVKSAYAMGEAVVTYHWQPSSSHQIETHTAYIRRLDNWNWVLAASSPQSITEIEATTSWWLVALVVFGGVMTLLLAIVFSPIFVLPQRFRTVFKRG